MTKGLARFLTAVTADFLDRHIRKGEMCMSSYECELLEKAFIEEDYEQIENYLNKKSEKLGPEQDSMKYAGEYSKRVWEMLMGRFKKNENFSIGCNDVSDIVLNAIIDALNGMSFSYIDQQQFVSEEEWAEYDRMMDGTVPENQK